MPEFDVSFTKVLHYAAVRVSAETSYAAALLVADAIRQAETDRGRRYTLDGDPAVTVTDNGLVNVVQRPSRPTG